MDMTLLLYIDQYTRIYKCPTYRNLYLFLHLSLSLSLASFLFITRDLSESAAQASSWPVMGSDASGLVLKAGFMGQGFLWKVWDSEGRELGV